MLDHIAVGCYHAFVYGLHVSSYQQGHHHIQKAPGPPKFGSCFCRYLFFVGTLMSQFTITGFDTCAHMAEETKGADMSAAWAIVMSVSASAIAGWGYLLALLFSIQVARPLKFLPAAV